jgi:hypothetical protein
MGGKVLEEIRMPAKYVVRLMFEWGGGCLWCGNDAAVKHFDVGPIEDRLPLSLATQQRLIELTEWHDTSLNWEYPPDPRPWPAEEFAKFDVAANEVLTKIQSELGSDFDVVYKPL